MQKLLPSLLSLFLATLIIGGLFSCNTTKQIKYFQNIPDSGSLSTIAPALYNEPTIQIDDILSITIQTVNPEATAMIAAGNVSSSNPSNVSIGALASTSISGYLVDKNGFIEIPVLGKLKVNGFTTSKLRDSLRVKAEKYFKEPSVLVRFANFKVSVTGEVTKPGQYIMPNEKVTVIDAIAMAGDLTIFGKRENVLLIRENSDGTKTPYRINLKKTDIFSQPYYYLKQNDIIYIEPRKAKSDVNDASQAKFAAIAGSLLSVLIILATRL